MNDQFWILKQWVEIVFFGSIWQQVVEWVGSEQDEEQEVEGDQVECVEDVGYYCFWQVVGKDVDGESLLGQYQYLQ